jgi:hypothetical protein
VGEDKVCMGCAFWLMPDANAPQKDMGQCRWGPPQVAVVMTDPPPVSAQESKIIQMAGGRPPVNPGPQPVFLSMWPSTKAGQGCGRWEKADGQAKADA